MKKVRFLFDKSKEAAEIDGDKMRYQSKWTKRTALGLAGMAMIWTVTTAQAQLFIDVYPSQDNTNQTIWVFGANGAATTPFYGSSIRGGGLSRTRLLENPRAILLGKQPIQYAFQSYSLVWKHQCHRHRFDNEKVARLTRFWPVFRKHRLFCQRQRHQRADHDRRKRKQNHREYFYERPGH